MTTNSLLRAKVSSHTEWASRPVIVVADADADTRQRLICMLANVDATIHEVDDGAALERLLERVRVDLVVTRSQLPRRTGLQVLALHRASGKATPFVVVHSFHQPLLRVLVSESASQPVLATRTVNADNLTELVIRLVRPTCAAAAGRHLHHP